MLDGEGAGKIPGRRLSVEMEINRGPAAKKQAIRRVSLTGVEGFGINNYCTSPITSLLEP
jgi:hypothetical protein